MDAGGPQTTGWSAIEPLRHRGVFRTVWTASLFSNFGQLILGVAAAWEMTRLGESAEMIALVQSALMLPMMLVSVPAGAFADMFDRRKIALVGLGFSILSAATLATLAALGFAGPWVLLLFCFLIGAGVALYAPAWQASIGDQVAGDQLPAAVALNSISYNLARTVGPAIGGILVLAAGAMAAFAVNALFYLPLFLAFLFWKAQSVPARLPPERIDRAIVSGVRYALNSGPVRTVMIRCLMYSLATACIMALTPLVARDLLHGDAATYGILLGVFGVGAIGGALLASQMREQMKPDTAVMLCALVGGLSIVAVGFSTHLWLTCLLMAVIGGANMATGTLFNVGVQLSVPRWVMARALSLYVCAMTGGIALGAWGWGWVASHVGVGPAVIASGLWLAATPVLAFLLPMPKLSVTDMEPVVLGADPEVALSITSRSGPVVIEIDYRVEADHARDFYNAMLALQTVRNRNGAFDWSLSRDIGDATLWTERFSFPTWGDYLRHRERFTQAEFDLLTSARAHNIASELRVRRRLERPFGSVRWRADTPDRGINIFTP